jgi:hypothetical protein
MRAWWWLTVVGCGRVGFDAVGTTGSMTDGQGDSSSQMACAAPVGHDDDGDGVDDACDGCPHLADPAQPDRDDDGVDDLCDPHPDTVGDHIADFDPFVTLRPEWQLDAGITLGTDQLLIDASNVVILHANWFLTPMRDTFAIRGHVSNVAASGQRQLNVRLRVGNAFYYASLLDPGSGSTSASVAYTLDNSTFTGLVNMPMPGAFMNGDFVLTLVTDPPNLIARVSWGSTDATLTGVPPAITPDHVDIAALGVNIQLGAFVRIHTD